MSPAFPVHSGDHRSFPVHLYDPLHQALQNDARGAETVIRATLPETLKYLLGGGPVRHVRIPDADDRYGQIFIGAIFEIGSDAGMPRGVCVLMHTPELTTLERARMDSYLMSVTVHYTERGFSPTVVPMVFQIPFAE